MSIVCHWLWRAHHGSLCQAAQFFKQQQSRRWQIAAKSPCSGGLRSRLGSKKKKKKKGLALPLTSHVSFLLHLGILIC